MYNVKTLNNIAPEGLDILEARGYNLGGKVEKPHGILVRSADMHSMEPNPELLAVVRAGAGTNNIPIDALTAQGIAVFNTPGANSNAVKELGICALLLASRDVLGGINWVRSIADKGEQIATLVESGKNSFTGPEITGKSLGVLGLGAVGSKIANTAIELGMRVYGYDPYLSVGAAWGISSQVIPAVDLETVFRNCDYITLHVPYMNTTHHMINRESIAKMKSGVRIINLARAELVNDEDLLEAIGAGRIARYVTDFPTALTAGADGVIPMPHLGSSTPESEEKCARMAAQQMFDYLENGNIQNSVNYPDCRLDRQGVSRLCVLHRNVPKMITRILDLTSERNINIEHMINKARGEYACTIIDLGTKIGTEISDKLSAMDEVMRVRIIDISNG